MRKFFSIVAILSILCTLAPIANAQEVSSPDSRWWVRTYNDLNHNDMPDDGEEVTGVDVQWGRVGGTTCSSVSDDTEFDATDTWQSPFFMVTGLGCQYYLVGEGVLSVTNYGVRKTSIDSQDLNPDVWIKMPCKPCNVFTPNIRAWSGR